MKKLIYLSIVIILSTGSAKAAGGPDAYGYTWITSLDPGGPAYNWIDITSRPGVQTVTGLADDNSAAGMINIGFPFHYYWNDYTQMKVGSNGWLSFMNISNIASCFPTIPTAGGAGDDYLALLMSDLNFTGAGNIGQVKYWTNNVDSFVISYINVPFWSVSAPGWSGSNSVQVILCGADTSIKFQYGSLGGFVNNAACTDLTVGIENSTGSVGLQVHSDAMPPSNYVILFDYPTVPLLAVPDITPKWNINSGNGGVFYPTGSFPITSSIKNVGNTNVTTTINITGNIRDISNTLIFTAPVTLPGMAAYDDSLITFSTPTIVIPGQYKFETTTSNSQDINAGNNTLITEIDLVNVCTSPFLLSYVEGNTSDGSINWNGGANDDGVAVHIVPPVYPVDILNMQAYVSSNIGNGLLTEIYADDGPGGSQGTLLYSGSIPSASIVSGAWNIHTITPITINSGGFYLVFYQTGTNIFIGTTSTAPLSRRNYEILDGGWGVYRENSIEDIMIRASMSNSNTTGPATPGPITGVLDFCMGGEDTLTYSIAPVAGATSYTWTLPGGWTGSSNVDSIISVAGSTGGNISVTASNICGTSGSSTSLITINSLPTVVANTTDNAICSGDSIILTGSGASSYSWMPIAPNGLSFIPSGTATYTVTGTDGNNCSNTGSVLITVNTPPVLVATSSDSVLCYGEFSSINFSGGDVYTWNGVPHGSSFLFGPAGSTYGAIVATDTTTGCTDTDTLFFTVNQLPVVDFNYAGSDTFCLDDGVQSLSGSTPSGGTYSGSGVSGTSFDPVAAGIGTNTLIYSYTDANSCTNSDSVDLLVLGCAGLDDDLSDQISIYPNPFTSTINIDGLQQNDQIQLYNLQGQILRNWNINLSNSLFNVSDLSSGVYLIKIISGDKSITKRIIKE